MEPLPGRTPPVFYDPAQRRWRRFRRVAQLVTVLLTIIFGVMIASILINPPLPSLGLAPIDRLLGRPVPNPAASPTPTVAASATPVRNVPSPTAVDHTPTVASQPTSIPTSPPVIPSATNLPNPTAPVNSTVAPPAPTGKSVGPDKTLPPPAQTAPGHQRTPDPGPKNTPRPAQTPPGQQRTRDPGPKNTPRPVTFNQPAVALAVPINSTDSHLPVAANSGSLLFGFYVSWSEVSFASLQQNLNRLDAVIPDWLSLAGSDGALRPTNSIKQTRFLLYVRTHRPDMTIVPLLNNYDYEKGTWDHERLSAVLANPAARARTIQNLYDEVQTNGFSGVNVDFEDVPAASQPGLVTFMRELYARFHPLGLTVSESVPLDNPDYAYRQLAQYSDYLIVMAYDEHWSGAPAGAGPVASHKWVAANLAKRIKDIPADRLVVAIGSYGYDWKANATTGATISFSEAMLIARDSQSPIRFDADSLNPTLDYTDENKALHHIWFLDGVTAFNQLVVIKPYRPRGIAIWRLGTEDPSLWQLVDHRADLNAEDAQLLHILVAGYDLDSHGSGEILRVAAAPHDGARQVTLDRSGVITSERFDAYPANYRVDRWGSQDRQKIALTFDDGPDIQYTPRVLDVLDRYHVPATFFVTGMNADRYTDLLKRELDAGHAIGNHTFSHPDLTTVSAQQLQFELNATQRVFESRLGRQSLLFRPPYGEDVDPVTADELKPLLTTSAMGYYTVGMQIDPEDWRSPGVDQIVERVIRQATTGGHIVLLHDGGGERSQTVAALPKIIEQLRARGYTLVLVSDLMRLDRDRLMPPLTPLQSLRALINAVGFWILDGVEAVLTFLFAAGILLGALRLGLVVLLAVIPRRKKKAAPAGYAPQVTVIVPAFNEEKVVGRTVQSLLDSTYPNLDIVVVDDGSTDHTYSLLYETFWGEPRVRLYTKANSGKADSLNLALLRTKAEIIVAIDADTIVLPDAVEKLVQHFADPRVGAVAGNAKVGNRINLLTEWQALEYITSQNLDRRAFALVNGITVVPGAIGAWRRILIRQVGGFSSDTLAEDAELTMAILRLGYQVEYEAKAIALTEAPDTLTGFLRQRFRWTYGTLQAAWKNLDALFRPGYGTLGMVALPHVFVFQVLFPIISPFMDLTLVIALARAGWQQFQNPGTLPDMLQVSLFFYALFLAMDYFAAFVAFLLEQGEDKSLLIWLFFQRLFYRQLLYYVALHATLTAIRGPAVGWGKLERKATVPGR